MEVIAGWPKKIVVVRDDGNDGIEMLIHFGSDPNDCNAPMVCFPVNKQVADALRKTADAIESVYSEGSTSCTISV
jgi:hypothetical protein